MAQQTKTAVGWLENELADKLKHIIENKDYILMEELFEKAKEIEKQQHGETWDKSIDTFEKRGHVYVRAWEDFEEYYQQTYKNEL